MELLDGPHLTDGAAETLLALQADLEPLLCALVHLLNCPAALGQLWAFLHLHLSPHQLRHSAVPSFTLRHYPPAQWLVSPIPHRDQPATAHLQLHPAAALDDGDDLPVGGLTHWHPANLQDLVSNLTILG